MIEVKTSGLRPTLLGLVAVALCLVGAPAAMAQGPDVIVGGLPSTNSYGTSGGTGIYAYSVATTSCNVGSSNLSWVASTNAHPVIAQDMWRLKDGRFTQIGNSWLKHGFCALQQNLCGACPGGGGCPSFLQPGCSDPYSASLNGQQGNLGPRSQVNAATGFFPYPFSAPPASGTIARRLQVHQDDLIAAQNVGALYFVSGQYVASDDAAFGNQANNASYRQVTVNQNSTFSLNMIGPTNQTQPPIQAWQDFQPTVTLVDVMADGLFIVGFDVIDNGNGTWRYEYAVFNLYSDRSGGSFTVPLPSGVTLTDVGFRGNQWHSGEPYSGTDWITTVTPGSDITWATSPHSTDPNAFALRWSKMFNFYFTADAPPATATGALGLFKPGAGADSHSVDLAAPSGNFIAAPGDVTCAQMMPTQSTAVLNWTNGTAYDSIVIQRDGATIATLAGTMTSYTDTGASFGESLYTVQGTVGPDFTAPIPCEFSATPMPVSGVTCTQTDPNLTDFTVNWSNGMTYAEIRVYVDASLQATLGGGMTTTTISGQAVGLHTVDIIGVVDGVESAGTGCAIDLLPPPPLGFTMRFGGGAGAYESGSGVGTAAVDLTVQESAANTGFPNPVQGLSASVSYDGGLLSASSVTEDPALGGVSFFNAELVTGGFTIGIVVDFANITTLDLSGETTFANASFATNSGGLAGNTTGADASINFTDGLGSGLPVENLVVADFVPVAPEMISGTITLTPGGSTGFKRSDANDDGSVNIADAIAILDYLFSGGSSTCLDALDANDDGSTNIADGIFVLSWLFSGGAEPPAPFGTCGADATADGLECDSYGGC
ncbi:MAG: hypothetical protein ACO4B3_09680 [Planctomycetota bacterium]